MNNFNEAGTSETASTNCRCKKSKKYSIFTPSMRSCASHRLKSKNFLRNERGLKNKSCQYENRLNFLEDTIEKVPSTDSSLSDLVNGQNLLKDFSEDFDKSIEEEVIEEFFSRKIKNVRKDFLTKEQKKLLSMEKPPLDRLKEIPIEYLKPRPPNHLKVKKQVPEELENFLKNVAQRANSVKMENLNKKKPYLHPNVEKMFHETFETSGHEITSGTQTDINWDKTVGTQTEKNFQKKLFHEIDAERKQSFLIDFKTSDENWREFLSKQEEHKNINLINPDFLKNSFHGPFYICSKLPLEKNHMDKAVNTGPLHVGLSEIDTSSDKSEVVDTQKLAKGGGDTGNKEPIDKKTEQEILECVLAENVTTSDYLGCLKIIETITRSVLKLNVDKKSDGHLKELSNLKEHHLQHILKEVNHLYDLDKFFKNFSSEVD